MADVARSRGEEGGELGIKFSVRSGVSGSAQPQDEFTVFLQAGSSRVEYGPQGAIVSGPGVSDLPGRRRRLAAVARWNDRVLLDIDLDQHKYTRRRVRPGKPPRGRSGPGDVSPTVRVEISARDTGERREILGYAARRVITTQVYRKSDAPPVLLRTVVDGWYIPAELLPSCVHDWIARQSTFNLPASVNASFQHVGDVDTGFAVNLRITLESFNAPTHEGQEPAHVLQSEMVVTDITCGTLDRQLFDVPKGYRRVTSIPR